jgi:hypothetical protein
MLQTHMPPIYFKNKKLYLLVKTKIQDFAGQRYPHLGVGIGQAARQGPMARPTNSPARPNSFNK